MRFVEVSRVQDVAIVWMKRPDKRNAIHNAMARELITSLSELDVDDSIRAVVIAGSGTVFCSGADVRWLSKLMDESKREAGDDEGEFSKLLRVLDGFSKVTIVRVHGAAYGIALSLIAACDIAVASVETDFCASEVKFGFVSPLSAKYLSRELGSRGARRILLCGEVFSAAEAYRLGLVHELATLENLDTAVNEILGHLVVGSPYAQMSTKRILNLLRREEGEEELLAMVSNSFSPAIAAIESQEGIAAFLERRSPSWPSLSLDKAPGRKSKQSITSKRKVSRSG